MIRKHKIYSRPRKLYDKTRIEEENSLVTRYGLKNKKEIWKASSAIDKIRRQAKILIVASSSEQEKLIKKLNNLGFKVNKIADILALNKEDWLKRRLQSVIAEKKFAKTPKAARQLIVHKHIAINGNIVNIPSKMVDVEEEDKIEIAKLKSKKPKENKVEIKIEGEENAGQ